ncbi:MAG: M64 family metallopeptidase [Smithella sp.]|jgi:hypothetical protein
MDTISEAATFQGFSDFPIIVSILAQSFNLQKPIYLSNLMRLCNALANKDSMTPLLSSGLPGTKFNMAVMGDGFAAGDDQNIYNNKVKDLLIHGVFNNDFFLSQKSAFNIYRVNLISQDSGVGTKTYDNNGNLISTVTKNTALGIYYNGDWDHCWLEDGPNTGNLIDNALNKWVPDYNIVLIFVNCPGGGGCTINGRPTVPLGIAWDTIAHELGHGIGGLGDEYCAQDDTHGVYTGPEPNKVNITINTNKATLKWKGYVDSITPIPTGIGKCVSYNQGTKPNDWDDNQSVGLFEGGGTYNNGIYRPVIDCRMNSNSPPFCPVCYAQMESITRNHMGTESAQNASEQIKTPDVLQEKSVPPLMEETVQKPKDNSIDPNSSDGYVRFKIHMENGKPSITDVKEVPGQLIAPKTVNLGYNYEVLTDDKLITLGFLPDVGVRRSFANRDVPGREGKHHITILPSFDFFVRVPKNQISEKTLSQMTIMVHDVKQAPYRLLKEVPLTKQTDFMSIEIGRMVGIKMDEIPKEVSSQLNRILKENEEIK